MLKYSIKACPICDSQKAINEVFCLPDYPLTEIFDDATKEFTPDSRLYINQNFYYCEECQHGFLNNIVSPDFLYSAINYNTHSSKSKGSQISLENFSDFIMKNQPRPAYTIDIGGNDSNLIARIDCERGLIIDPNAYSESANYECINEFIESIDPRDFNEEVINVVSSHTMEHIESPHTLFNFINNIKNLKSVYIQVPCLEIMARASRYDLVHHQHLHYFTLSSLSVLARMHEFSVLSHEYDYSHYGTIRVHLAKNSILQKDEIKEMPNQIDTGIKAAKEIKAGYQNFNKIANMQSEAWNKLPEIYCYGAALMLPIVYYYYPLLHSRAIAIIDSDEAKTLLRFANISTPIIYDNSIQLEKKSIIITAVATRSACRNIIKQIVDRNPLHLVIPFGEF